MHNDQQQMKTADQIYDEFLAMDYTALEQRVLALGRRQPAASLLFGCPYGVELRRLADLGLTPTGRYIS